MLPYESRCQDHQFDGVGHNFVQISPNADPNQCLQRFQDIYILSPLIKGRETFFENRTQLMNCCKYPLSTRCGVRTHE